MLTTNPFIKHTYELRSDLCKKTQSNQPLYNLTPFHVNPFLPKVLRDGTTQVWFTKGVRTFGVPESFEDLTARYSLNKKHFFKSLQLKHHYPNIGSITPLKDYTT